MAGARRSRRGDGESERRAELVDSLRSIAAARGPNVTLRRFCRDLDIPTSHVYRDFDSWSELRQAAGLPASIDRRRAAAVHTRESLLAALKEVVEDAGDNVSLTEFWRRTGISVQPIVRVFGSWREMRAVGGLPPVVPCGPRSRWSRDDLLALLQQASRDRKYVTLREFCTEVGVSTATVDRLGPWTALRKELGLPRRGSRRRADWSKWNRDMLIDWDEWQTSLGLNEE